MNIFGTLIFFVIGGILIWRPKASKTDYSRYPVTVGEVKIPFDACGDRWLVDFIDEEGMEVVGMDDIAYEGGTFHPERYHLPKRKTMECIYYWKMGKTEQGHYFINGKPITHYIHFCDETLYELNRKKERLSIIGTRVLGSCIIFAGLIVFLHDLF